MPLISQKELAGHLGLSTRQIRNLEDQGVVLPQLDPSGKKRYPWPESNQRYWGYKIQEARGDRTSDQEKQADAEMRKAVADAEAAEMKVALMRNSLISIDDVERLVSEPLEMVYSALKNLPNRWGAMLVGCTTTHEVIGRLKPAVEEAIEALQAIGESVSAEIDDGDDEEDD